MQAAIGNALSVLDRLRCETRGEHDAIEQALQLNVPTLTPALYRRRIAQFYGFYRPLEILLHGDRSWQPWPIDGARRRKAPLLEADLRALDIDPKNVALCMHLPRLDSLAERFGCLYVLEGSTLGGQVISRHLCTSLGITPARGGSFFDCYGEQTGAMWRTFRTTLNDFAVATGLHDAVVLSAISTFESLRLWCRDEDWHDHRRHVSEKRGG